MKQPSTHSESRYVQAEVHDKHYGQSDFDVCHGANGSASEPPGAYLLQCMEQVLQLSRREERFFVDEQI